VTTRQRILFEIADKSVRLFGTHFPGESTGFVTTVSEGSFRLDP